MSNGLYIVNDGVVGIFGAFLSAAFSSISWNRKNKMVFAAALCALGLLQMGLFAIFGAQALRLWYPLITHAPLAIVLGCLGGGWLWSITSVQIAYLCCQLRRWLALLCVAVFSGGDAAQALAELALTLPLGLLLIVFAAPGVRGVAQCAPALQIQFGLLPMIYYGFDYITCVYTDLLIGGNALAVEFMPFVCALAYLAFTLNSAANMRKQSEMERVRIGLDLQVKQSARLIDDLRQSQAQTAAYRHDLRHHLQYLSACMDEGKILEAQAYMRTLDENITRQSVVQYCENRVANLIVSAYAGRAEEAGIAFSVRMQMDEGIRAEDGDLCVLLSNALENALNACKRVAAAGEAASISVRSYMKAEQLFLEIVNSCIEDVEFEGGIPVCQQSGHGFGVRSICAMVEKYGGIYSFEADAKDFYLRLSL